MERWKAKDVNDQIRERIAPLREDLAKQGVTPRLATLRVGNRPDDLSYIKSLERVMEKLDIELSHKALSEYVDTEQVVCAMKKLSEDPNVDGILLMQPLPKGIDTLRVKEAIAEEKDLDGTTLLQMGKMLAGVSNAMTPAAAAAVMETLDFHQVDLTGKSVILIGSGVVVGRPLAMRLLERAATVTLTNSHTKDLDVLARNADVLISAAGVAGMVKENFVHSGQIVIDVGVSWKNGKLCGDVDWNAIAPIAWAATPTPGGIGSITSTLIAERVVKKAAQRMKSRR